MKKGNLFILICMLFLSLFMISSCNDKKDEKNNDNNGGNVNPPVADEGLTKEQFLEVAGNLGNNYTITVVSKTQNSESTMVIKVNSQYSEEGLASLKLEISDSSGLMNMFVEVKDGKTYLITQDPTGAYMGSEDDEFDINNYTMVDKINLLKAIEEFSYDKTTNTYRLVVEDDKESVVMNCTISNNHLVHISTERNNETIDVSLSAFGTTTVNLPEYSVIDDSKPYKREWNKIYFGKYPQTKVTNSELISKLNALAGTLPTAENLQNWTDYNYYISSKITSFMYYQDIDYDNDGSFDYRGVYFTKYRPYYIQESSYDDNNYQLSNGYEKGTTYWFKYELIEWDVLDETESTVMIIAHLSIDGGDFEPVVNSKTYEHNGGTGYSSNYELSSIRKFLNDDFYNTAFNELQKSIILNVKVDNSASSFGSSDDKYACADTYDNIFLLSYKEVSKYFTSNAARQNKCTDYAKCQGVFTEQRQLPLDCVPWLLRSPDNTSAGNCYAIRANGQISVGNVYLTDRGIRPVCWIEL